eukprot:2082765-Alexandrium_andersonii.AAC.1
MPGGECHSEQPRLGASAADIPRLARHILLNVTQGPVRQGKDELDLGGVRRLGTARQAPDRPSRHDGEAGDAGKRRGRCGKRQGPTATRPE